MMFSSVHRVEYSFKASFIVKEKFALQPQYLDDQKLI